MPSLAYLRAAKMPGKEPVLLAQIDNTGEQSAEYGTQTDWAGSSTLTRVDTDVDPGKVLNQYKKTFANGVAGNVLYADITSAADVAAFGDVLSAVNVGVIFTFSVPEPEFPGSTASFNMTHRLKITIDGNVTYTDEVSGSYNGPVDNSGAPTIVCTDSFTQSYTLPALLDIGALDSVLIEFDVVSISIIKYSIYTGTLVSIDDEDIADMSTTLLSVPKNAADCLVQTSTIDMGSVPTADVVLSIDDVKPSGTSIAFTMLGGNTDPPTNNLGVVADGDTLTGYQYYKPTGSFASNNGARARLSRFGLQTTEKIIYSTRKNAPLIGALPYLPEDAFNEQSSSIDIDKPSTVGQTTLRLLWRKPTSDIVATGYLKGKAVSLMHGFDGLPSGDFEPLFTGSWYDYSADHEKMLFEVEIQDVLKKFMKIKLPLETFDSSGNKITLPLEWTTPTNIMQVSLDIIDELGIPDRFIDRPAIEALRDGDFNTPDYDVTRSITNPTEAWKLLYELSVIGGFFWVPMPDGTLLPVPFDPNTTPAVVLDARKVSVGKLKGGQKDIFTRQLIYYDVAAGVTDPGENEEDYDKGLRQISTTAENNWGEKSEKRFFEKWAASVYLVDQLAHRREGWYSDPKHSFGIEDVPIHHIGANPGQIIQINNLRIPTAAADWGNLSTVCCLMLSKKVDPLDGNISYGVRQIFVPNIFYPTSVAFSAGTGTGNIADMQNADGTYYTVNEVTATPGFEVDFTFANVDQDVQQLTFKGRYEGNVGHSVEIQIYDNDATAWVDVRVDTKDLPHSTTDYYRVFDLPHPIGRYRDGSDNVKVKIIHTTAGNSAHKLYIDQLRLRT